MSQQSVRHLKIEADSVGFLLIDAQPAFWTTMYGPREPVMARVEHALLLAGSFSLPTIATFEHPVETKGWLPQRLERVFPSGGQRLVKHTFDCCEDKQIRAALQNLEVRQVVVAGAETDVCVLQSVLGLVDMGFQVFVMEDGLFTSEPAPHTALMRMHHVGAIPISYKSLYYELKGTVDVEPFHLAWNAQFGDGQERYLPPEKLPRMG